MRLTEKSILGKIWELQNEKSYLAGQIKTHFNLPEMIARIISQRGDSIEEIATFLDPKLRSALPNPFDLKDMEKAANRFVNAIEKNERIAVFGDYDVDGITSSSILYLFFESIGYAHHEFHIPEREADGYGPSIPVFEKFIKNGAQLIVTVDCGITANQPVDYAMEKGVDVVILDHHEPQLILPKSYALVDPKRLDEDGKNTYFAAVGIVFLFLVAVNKILREKGWYEKNKKEPVDLLKFSDLVALGTVCDMVPLIKANRAFVATGLKIMKNRENIGIKALADVGKAGLIKEYHLGFVLGPRINAGGRVGYSRIGLELLTAKDNLTAEILAEKLDKFNTERKEIELAIFAQAQAEVDDNPETHSPLVFVAREKWHPGVMGIIAGRLKEHYGRPTLAAVIDDAGRVNGSGRSISGIDLGCLIVRAKEKGLIDEGGGHMMAVGFSCQKENLEAFRAFLKEEIERELKGKPLTQIISVDSVLDAGALSFELGNALECLEPFGVDNHEPVFVLKNAQLSKATLFGTGHLKCFFKASNGKSLVVLLFGGTAHTLGQTLLSHIGETFDLAGHLRINIWQGQKNIQFHLLDAAKA